MKLKKHFKKMKKYIAAQKFYVRKALNKCRHFKNKALKALKLMFIASLFGIASVMSVLIADRAHKQYLEHVIGSQILFVKSLPDSQVQGSATGFHVKTPHGNVVFLTNAHVCGLANAKGMIAVEDKMYSGRLVPRRVLEVYTENDLCAVEPLPGYDGLSIGSKPLVGEPVWAIGYPLGESLNITGGRVKDYGTTSLVSEIPVSECSGPRLKKESMQIWFFIIDVCIVTFDSVQTDLVIYGGNSGSPMLNIWGHVVGVVFAADTRSNWGRVVPLSYVEKFLEAY